MQDGPTDPPSPFRPLLRTVLSAAGRVFGTGSSNSSRGTADNEDTETAQQRTTAPEETEEPISGDEMIRVESDLDLGSGHQMLRGGILGRLEDTMSAGSMAESSDQWESGGVRQVVMDQGRVSVEAPSPFTVQAPLPSPFVTGCTIVPKASSPSPSPFAPGCKIVPKASAPTSGPFSSVSSSEPRVVAPPIATPIRIDLPRDLRMPIHEMATALRDGRLTSEELVRASLGVIRNSPTPFVQIFEDSAIIQARAADIRRLEIRGEGRWPGPLNGVPVAVKDLFDVAWAPTEAGSPQAMRQRIVNHDALVVERLRAAGAVIVGKTHCSELACSSLGYNPHYKTPLTPFGRARGGCVPGGSSGGSAVAVAEGLVFAAVGTDMSGSTQIPSAWCGITGFKPTYGSVPLKGCQLLSESFDSVATLANCVEDCALLQRVMQGKMKPTQATMEIAAPVTQRSPETLRLLVPISGWAPWPGFKELEGAVRVTFEAALDALSEEGMSIERTTVASLDSLLEPFNIVLSAEAAATHADLLADEARLASLDPLVRERLEFGAKLTATQYLKARTELRNLRVATDEATAGFDAVLMPTVPMGPPLLSDLLESADAMREAARKCESVARITNALERCSVTLPCHAPPIITNKLSAAEPVPVGLLVMGKTGGDEACLAVAATIESTLRRVYLGKWRPATSSSQVDANPRKRARLAKDPEEQ